MYLRKDNAFSNGYITLILKALCRIWARKSEWRVRIPLRTYVDAQSRCPVVAEILGWFNFPGSNIIACLSTYSYNFILQEAKCRVVLWNIKLVVFELASIVTFKKLVHWFQCTLNRPLVFWSLNELSTKTRNNKYTTPNFKVSLIKLVASRISHSTPCQHAKYSPVPWLSHSCGNTSDLSFSHVRL